MELHQIPRADLLDILFEGRNKSYGAYDLRKTYNRRLGKAIAITVSLCLLLIFGYVLAGKLERPKPVLGTISDPFTLIKAITTEKEIVVPLPPAHRALPPIVATINDRTPRIVHDADVKPDEVPRTQDQMENVKLGTTNRQGIPDDGMPPTPQSDGIGKGLLDKPEQKEAGTDDGIVPVEIESSYIGGLAAWKRFVERTVRYPEAAIDKNIQGTVMVQFVVDKEGRITDIQAISGPEELQTEAVRAIRSSQGKWNPGIQNGRKVKSYKRQPIVFSLGSND